VLPAELHDRINDDGAAAEINQKVEEYIEKNPENHLF
jgi:hypothetical protein